LKAIAMAYNSESPDAVSIRSDQTYDPLQSRLKVVLRLECHETMVISVPWDDLQVKW
jgi:hypothetical protein